MWVKLTHRKKGVPASLARPMKSVEAATNSRLGLLPWFKSHWRRALESGEPRAARE